LLRSDHECLPDTSPLMAIANGKRRDTCKVPGRVEEWRDVDAHDADDEYTFACDEDSVGVFTKRSQFPFNQAGVCAVPKRPKTGRNLACVAHNRASNPQMCRVIVHCSLSVDSRNDARILWRQPDQIVANP
jgi:hypothetical protein